MKLISLVENTSCRADCGCIHGLSLYLETPLHKILFDMGPNALFLENAQRLGVDLAAVDIAFLSHGHYDHAGGLELFCKRNEKASIYLHSLAFGQYYVSEEGEYVYIGVDPHAKKYTGRFVTAGGRIDEELTLFDGVDTHDYLSAACAALLEKDETGYHSDPFRHEQNLILSCEGKKVLLAGCAHNGIVNILRRAEDIVGGELDWVFSGFHLTNPSTGRDEPRELIEAVGRELMARHTRFVTGHCTGQGPFALLKDMMGNQLEAMPAGSVFTF